MTLEDPHGGSHNPSQSDEEIFAVAYGIFPCKPPARVIGSVFAFLSRQHHKPNERACFMPCVRYRGYLLSIMLALNNECETGFSSIVEISKGERDKPFVTLYDARPTRSEQEAIPGGFELGAHWIDETLPELRGSRTALPWFPVRNQLKLNIAHSKQIRAELHSAMAASWHIVSRTKKLLSRSSKIHRTGLQGEDRA